METTFPVELVRLALAIKLRDTGTGPVVAVLFSHKYGRPMLSFCTGPTSST